MKTLFSWKGYGGIFTILFCLFFWVFATASESKDGVTFTATDSADIVWVLEETPGKLVVSQTFPNEVTVTVETNDVMCNRLETETQVVQTMDLEISEVYFLFHKLLDKSTGETRYQIQLSHDKRSQLSVFTNVTGDFCLSN